MTKKEIKERMDNKVKDAMDRQMELLKLIREEAGYSNDFTYKCVADSIAPGDERVYRLLENLSHYYYNIGIENASKDARRLL